MGATGAPGTPGTPGTPGAPGTGLDLFDYAEVTTEESTTSTSFTDLATAGPAVTTTVPQNGLVSVFAQADIKADTGGTLCQIGLAEDGTNIDATNALFASNGNTAYQTFYPFPGTSTGIANRLFADGRTIPAPAGTHTYKLTYRKSGAGICSFKNRKLWVAPLGG